MPTISLRPGTPDDDNRDYLPEALKQSDVVVNENGNNSQPYPPRLEEHTEALLDDEPDTWFLYIPESYRPEQPTPLVVSVHGGMMTGWGQAVYTSWTMIAEREGFIVLFPNAHSRRIWLLDIPADQIDQVTAENDSGVFMNRPPEDADDNRDLRLIRTLIERLQRSHNVDPERVYMQGMSLGDAMTDQFTRYFGNLLAGAAGSGGPTAPALLFDDDGSPRNRAGAVPVWQTRLELDAVPPHYAASTHDVIAAHRSYWLSINQAKPLPRLAIRGSDNFAFYDGELSPVVFRDVKNRDHGQTLDDAELVWSYLFSGTRRLPDGRVEITEPRRPRSGDAVSIAVAAGRQKAWARQSIVDMHSGAFSWETRKYHGLGGKTETRRTMVYVPVGFIAEVFGASIERAPGIARLRWPLGPVLEVARGSAAALVDGDVTAMLAETTERDQELFLPLEWVAQNLLGLRATACDGVVYVTDHHAELSTNMAALIDDLLA